MAGRIFDLRLPEPVGLARASWLFCVAYGLLVTAAVCFVAWPGFMSFDSLTAYEQGLYGIQTMLWPPLHAYMFGLSHKLGAGPGGVLALQTFLLFTSAAATVFALVRGPRLAGLLCAAFALSFIYVPPQLGSLMALWRDVTTTSFAFLALALWLQAAAKGSRVLLVAAAVGLGLAVALRYNAFALVFAMAGLMVWRPFLGRPATGKDRVVVAVALVLSLTAAWASTHWRLPDLMQLPPSDNAGGTQEFDVVGISACAGRNYLPAEATSGVSLTVEQLRATYDPRHMHKTLAPKPGVPRILETDASGQMPKIWRRLLTTETGCYLAHRALVATEQMGMAKTPPFYPVHSGIDPNQFGLKLARPGLAEGVKAYVERNAGEALRRPYLLYLGAFVAVGVILVRRRNYGLLLLALLADVFAYPALLFVAAPAADARYIFPSNTLAALIIVLCAGLLLERRAPDAGA